MLFPSHKVAEQCRSFMKRYYAQPTGTIRLAEFEITPPKDNTNQLQKIPIHIVLFPKDAFPIAKQFWQHSGDIISSRMAEYCLRIFDEENEKKKQNENVDADLYQPKKGMGMKSKSRNHYSSAKSKQAASPPKEETSVEQNIYLEERYGRNLPVKFSNSAKIALRRRIAGVLTSHNDKVEASDEKTSSADLEQQRQMTGERNIKGLSEEDVYLYPCGMSAIFHAHQVSMIAGDDSIKSVCFG